jgi:hypothetical protein
MKTPMQSKTIKFNILMGFIDAIVINAQLLEQLMTDKQFAVLFLVLSAIHKGGNVYLRFLTSESIKR